MANNPYVNKVKYGNQTVMDITDTTAEESDVAEGEVFYKGSGERAVGTGNYYSPNDTVETDIDDADYFPFYDTSANSNNGAKRKSLWSNIKAKLNEIFYRRSEASILGAKNLLPYPYGSGASLSSGGVSYSVDADGIVTASNSATSDSTFFIEGTNWGHANFVEADKILRPNTEYILTAGIENNVDIYIHAVLQNSSGTNVVQWRTRLDEEKIGTTPADLSGLRFGCWIRIRANTAISTPIKIYPMIRLTSDTDDTFSPYATSNRNLSINKTENSVIAPVENGSTASRAYAIGDYFIYNNQMYKVASAIAQGGTITIGTNAVDAGTVMEQKEETELISGYSTSGLTPSSYFTLESGGYARCGKLIIVNMRLKAKQTISSGYMAILSRMPLVADSSLNKVTFSTNRINTMAYLNNDIIYLQTSSTIAQDEIVMISGVYITS